MSISLPNNATKTTNTIVDDGNGNMTYNGIAVVNTGAGLIPQSGGGLTNNTTLMVVTGNTASNSYGQTILTNRPTMSNSLFLRDTGGHPINIDFSTYSSDASTGTPYAPPARIYFADTGSSSGALHLQTKVPGSLTNALTDRLVIGDSGPITIPSGGSLVLGGSTSTILKTDSSGNVSNAVYKLGTSILTGTVMFYGDSITTGAGLGNPSTQRFSSLLAAQYSFTESNVAVAGSTVQDMIKQVYNNHVPGRTAIVKIGFNDADVNGNTENTLFQFRECLMNNLLYIALTSSQLIPNNGTNTTRVGGFSPGGSPYNNVRYYTSNSGDSISTTTPVGRYVGFMNTTFTSGTCNATVSIDGGTAILFHTPLAPFTTPNGSTYSAIPWVYDTGVSSTHTILVTNSSGSTMDIEFFFAFDNLSAAGNSPIVLILNESNNFYRTWATVTNFSAGTVQRQKLLNDTQSALATFFRQEYGAKITCVNETPYWGWGNKLSDMINPDVQGHVRIQNRVNSTLTGGELVGFI